jgi:hypothetical protein
MLKNIVVKSLVSSEIPVDKTIDCGVASNVSVVFVAMSEQLGLLR